MSVDLKDINHNKMYSERVTFGICMFKGFFDLWVCQVLYLINKNTMDVSLCETYRLFTWPFVLSFIRTWMLELWDYFYRNHMQYQSEILKYFIKVIETLDESPNKRLQKPHV